MRGALVPTWKVRRAGSDALQHQACPAAPPQLNAPVAQWERAADY